MKLRPFSLPAPRPAALALALSLSLPLALQAEVKPNALFTDNAVLQQDLPVPVWGTAAEGEKVAVAFDGKTVETVAKDGKWRVTLPPHAPGGPFTLTVTGDQPVADHESKTVASNVLVGEVWICGGQSNMAFTFDRMALTPPGDAQHPDLRLFNVKQRFFIFPNEELIGEWKVCTPETVGKFSVTGYYFGRDLQRALGRPVGLINNAISGSPAQSWVSAESLASDPAYAEYSELAKGFRDNYEQNKAEYPARQKEFHAQMREWNKAGGDDYQKALKAWQEEAKATGGTPATPKPVEPPGKPQGPAHFEGGLYHPTVLFNAMVQPLLPVAIRGVVWYQGESNDKKTEEYKRLFPHLIANWREKWAQPENRDFPFIFAQIAPFKNMPPELREAQAVALDCSPNTAMVVTLDVGDAEDIHPRPKEPVGHRLALAARKLAYGENIEASGPVFQKMEIEGSKAVIHFRHVAGGLKAGATNQIKEFSDHDVQGFTIAGADKNFVPARAEIVGETVVVSSPEVPTPAAVRYGWANVPLCNLFNKEDLPAAPFRTDSSAQQ